MIDLDDRIENDVITAWYEKADCGLTEPITILGEPFTKSNGTVVSRIYERLTKASRRRGRGLFEDGYRQGVYETLKALQQELQ